MKRGAHGSRRGTCTWKDRTNFSIFPPRDRGIPVHRDSERQPKWWEFRWTIQRRFPLVWFLSFFLLVCHVSRNSCPANFRELLCSKETNRGNVCSPQFSGTSVARDFHVRLPAIRQLASLFSRVQPLFNRRVVNYQEKYSEPAFSRRNAVFNSSNANT